jgi:hypothetical protein
MERRTIIDEYFQLRAHLNRANQRSDQITEIRFEIRERPNNGFVLLAVSATKNEIHRLVIAERQHKNWERTGATIFRNLEIFCAQCLNQMQLLSMSPDQSSESASELMLQMEKGLSQKLKMLLLNHSYEP